MRTREGRISRRTLLAGIAAGLGHTVFGQTTRSVEDRVAQDAPICPRDNLKIFLGRVPRANYLGAVSKGRVAQIGGWGARGPKLPLPQHSNLFGVPSRDLGNTLQTIDVG